MSAIFQTKIVHDRNRNEETVEILEKRGFQYRIRFSDGTELWAYGSELDFR